jgi:post-segregation antitoxin (ccd killing protein)
VISERHSRSSAGQADVAPVAAETLNDDLLIYGSCNTKLDYTMSEVVTLRIDEETKRRIKRYGISVSQVARAAILQEIERREREEALQALRRMREILKKVDTRRVVEHIREDRGKR